MRLLYINNDGGGFADYVDVTEGITVEQFFKDKMQGRKPDDFLIRVNRQPVSREYVLKEGDRDGTVHRRRRARSQRDFQRPGCDGQDRAARCRRDQW